MVQIYALADYIVAIIFGFALVEMVLFAAISLLLRTKTVELTDSLRNILWGLPKFMPQKDSRRDRHDEIAALLDNIKSVLEAKPKGHYDQLLKNLQNQRSRNLDRGTYGLANWANVATVIVNVFPLLGILGTILALGQAIGGYEVGTVEVETALILRSFINAIDTTIYGLFFAIIYMIINALVQSRLERLLLEMEQYRKILNLFMQHSLAVDQIDS
jgi:biopolymer transport protein ExbB/TolQ